MKHSSGMESQRSEARTTPSAGRQVSRGSAAVRETIESIVIAFVLAFVFRTFVAEMFVIPTGSMATTLLGRHKEVVCPECGAAFQVSSSEEVDAEGSQATGHKIVQCVCPTCRNPVNVSDEERYPSFTGDRIVVAKSAFVLTDPQRWDVAVFKYPKGATMNYIKRVVGLPGETIRIQHGDIYVRPDGATDFQIARKPPRKLRTMLQMVYDNERMPALAKLGLASRWRADDARSAAWQTNGEQTVYSIAGGPPAADGASAADPAASPREAWLRYWNLVPTADQWISINQRQAPSEPPPQLISDFLAYNTGLDQPVSLTYRRPYELDATGRHWVSDLALQCTVDVQSDDGQWTLELVKGGRHFQCRVDVATGNATLSVSGADMADFRPTAATALRGRGQHRILFANCDQQLRLWVDGDLVEFPGGDAATAYGDLNNYRPTVEDLRPLGIASRGAGLQVSELKVWRDIYYIAFRADEGLNTPTSSGEPDFEPAVFRDPAMWPAAFGRQDYVDFPLQRDQFNRDQFLMLGDNSAKSSDSRYWSGEHFVSRELLIGKAVFIYWPHALNRPIPFFPNFWRMGFVR